MKLLGIHWGQFPENWTIVEGKVTSKVKKHSGLITEGAYVEGLSGMTCVIPGQDIAELLKTKALDAMRKEHEVEYSKILVDSP